VKQKPKIVRTDIGKKRSQKEIIVQSKADSYMLKI